VILKGYYQNDQMKDRMGGACRTPGRQEKHIQSSVGRRERKKPLGRYGHKLENDTKFDLKEQRWVDSDWIRPAQDGIL
jgi:hypothetical protein